MKNEVVLPLFDFAGNVVNGTAIDGVDAEWLSSILWRANWMGGAWYAVKSFGDDRNRRRLNLRMHVEIAKKRGFHVEGLVIDHINGDGLDNRSCNLRAATPRENSCNARMRIDNTVGYRGVAPSGNKWYAQIRVNGVSLYLGTYTAKIDAAIAYNEAAIKHHGKFASLNQIQARTEINDGR